MKRFITLTLSAFFGIIVSIFQSGCQKDAEDMNYKAGLTNDTVLIDTICIDIDGNIYHVMQIGNQLWLTENLKVTHYNDSTPIACIEDPFIWSNTYEGAYCSYNNDTLISMNYGLLYNWYAVNTEKLAPEGWRVPSDDDWKRLEYHLGLDLNLLYYEYGFRGVNEASKIAGSPECWVDGSLEADTSFAATSFNALPSGRRYYDGSFDYINHGAYWWSTTEQDDTYAYRRHLWYNLTSISRTGAAKTIGFPIRCVKDIQPLKEVSRYPGFFNNMI